MRRAAKFFEVFLIIASFLLIGFGIEILWIEYAHAATAKISVSQH